MSQPTSEVGKIAADGLAVAAGGVNAAEDAAKSSPRMALVLMFVAVISLGGFAILRTTGSSACPPFIDPQDLYTKDEALRDWAEQRKVNDTVRSLIEGQFRVEKRLDAIESSQKSVERSLYRIEGRLSFGEERNSAPAMGDK